MKAPKIVLCFLILLVLSEAINIEQPHYHLRRVTDHERRTRGGSGGAAGFIIGPILFLFSFVLIWVNQRKSAIDTRRLNLASTLVQEVNPFVQSQIAEANMKLTHITGKSVTQQTVTDMIARVSLNNVIKIKRIVEVKEFRQVGSDDNRRTQLMWVTEHESAHGNDSSAWFINNETTKARQVAIGNYFLSQGQIDNLQCTTQYSPNMQNAQSIAQNARRQYGGPPTIQGQYIYFPSHNGGIQDHGALRVKFQYCPNGDISIVARSHGNTFEPFEIDKYENEGKEDESGTACDCCCCFMCACAARICQPISEIDLIVQEMQSYQEMIEHELSNVKCRTWAVRVLSFILMVAGICIFFSPITILLGYIPLVGGILKGTVGIIILVAAVIVCIPLFLIAVTVSWMIFHPKVGLIILGVAVVVTGIILALALSNKPEVQSDSDSMKHLSYFMNN